MKGYSFILSFGMFVSSMLSVAQTAEYQQVWSADQGDGTYVNPIINADFPDPDVIRVDDTY